MFDSTMKRIVWVGGYPAHYVRSFHRRLENLHPDKLEFLYLRPDGGDPDRRYEEGGLPSRSVVLAGASVLDVVRHLRGVDPKAIILAGHYPRSLVAAALWGFAKNVPVLYWSDTNLLDVLADGTLRRAIRRVTMRILLRRMFRLLYIGSRNREYYLWACGKSIGAERLCWLPYPHMISSFSRSSRTPNSAEDSKKRVLYLGRISKEKAVGNLIRAFHILPTKLKDRASLVIAGDGAERFRVERLAEQLKLNGVVRFLGAIPSGEAPLVFRDADIFVIPSDREPWGLVVNEAMSAGLPVIAPNRIGAVPDLVIDGQTGIVTEDNRPESLAEAIARLLESGELAERMGLKGRQLVEGGGWSADGALGAFARIVSDLEKRA